MSNVKRPPSSITAHDFFTGWLPSEFRSEFGQGSRNASDITVAVILEGDGGGHWILDVRSSELSVRQPGQAGADPQVVMRQTIADWRAVAVGEDGAIDLAPPQASPLDVLFVDPASRQVMSQVRGTIRFEVTGYNGRCWWMVVKFGTQPEALDPDATISVDAQTYAAMLARKMAPPEAYFQGKIQLRGDTALGIQLGMAMLPRFTA